MSFGASGMSGTGTGTNATYSKDLNLYKPGVYNAPAYKLSITNSGLTEYSSLPLVESAASFGITNYNGQSILDIPTQFESINANLTANRTLAINELNALVISRTLADIKFQDDLKTETDARVASYDVIAANIATEEAALNTQVSSVTASRYVSSSNINSALSTETTERKAADVILNNNIDSTIVSNNSAQQTNVLERSSNDSNIESNITSGFVLLNASHDAVVAGRVAAESDVQSALDTEVANFGTSLTTLVSSIDTLVTRLQTDESNLAQTVANYTAADTTIISSIVTLQSDMSSLYSLFISLKHKVDTAIKK